MGTTPEYTKSAINKYNEKFDRKAVNLPKGTAERIKQLTGKSCNAYIVDLVLTDLERLERKANNSIPSTENTPNQPNTEPSKAKNTIEAAEDSTQRYLELLESENRARIGEAEYMRQAQEFENMKRSLAAQMGLDYDEIIRSKQQNAQEAQEPPF